MKKRCFLWQTIYNKLLNKGVVGHDIDIRYLQRWINLYPCCFPKFMLSNSYTAIFNWELCRWEIYKLKN
jgi:hypothetical protein